MWKSFFYLYEPIENQCSGFFLQSRKIFFMANLFGEFPCTIDTKGRIMLPKGLKKQLGKSVKTLVVKRGFENCLILYPKQEWDIIAAKVNKLSDFVKNNRTFKRYYFQGATELAPDGNARILIPKSLQEHAGLKNGVVLFAYSNQIEIWSAAEYGSLLKNEPKDFSDLAEKVMGEHKEGDE